MLVEEELAKFSPEQNTAITIGVFDGVHLGHKHLIARLLEVPSRRTCSPVSLPSGSTPRTC